jgi:hypothetical protein
VCARVWIGACVCGWLKMFVCVLSCTRLCVCVCVCVCVCKLVCARMCGCGGGRLEVVEGGRNTPPPHARLERGIDAHSSGPRAAHPA